MVPERRLIVGFPNVGPGEVRLQAKRPRVLNICEKIPSLIGLVRGSKESGNQKESPRSLGFRFIFQTTDFRKISPTPDARPWTPEISFAPAHSVVERFHRPWPRTIRNRHLWPG